MDQEAIFLESQFKPYLCYRTERAEHCTWPHHNRLPLTRPVELGKWQEMKTMSLLPQCLVQKFNQRAKEGAIL